MCGAKGCWSSKHSELERQQSKERFLAKLNKKANQFLAEADIIQDLEANKLESKMEALIIESSSVQQDDDTSEVERTEQWVTSFGATSDNVAYATLTEIQNTATAHAITRNYNNENQFTYISENRYSTDKFYDIMIDTGASNARLQDTGNI